MTETASPRRNRSLVDVLAHHADNARKGIDDAERLYTEAKSRAEKSGKQPDFEAAIKAQGDLVDAYRAAADSIGMTDFGSSKALQRAAAREVRAAIGKAVLSGSLAPTTRIVGVVGDVRRARWVSEVVAARETDSRLVEYVRSGPQTYAADIHAEGETKPLTDLSLTKVPLSLNTIAHRAEVARGLMLDDTSIESWVGQSLLDGLMRRLDDHILADTIHVDPDIPGDTATTDASDILDTVAAAIAAIRDDDHEPDIVILSPSTWRDIITGKTASGSNLYIAQTPVDSIIDAGSRRLWGVPVLVTPAAANAVTVADMTSLGTLYVRENPRVDWSEAEGFSRNVFTARCEATAAYAVQAPDAARVIVVSEGS